MARAWSPDEFRGAFASPVAHRGLHNGTTLIENTAPAMQAGLDAGFGCECDLQAAADGTPYVFHDETLNRLVDGAGRLDRLMPADIAKLRYKNTAVSILPYAAFLELAAGRGPLLVEIKTTWGPIPPAFLKQIGDLSKAYNGPLALMSFDPAAMRPMRELAPHVPRGLVSGMYRGPGWWYDLVGSKRSYRLSHMLDAGDIDAAFVAYHVKSLPTPVTDYIREAQKKPVFTWTVRTEADLDAAHTHADAPIFETIDPTVVRAKFKKSP